MRARSAGALLAVVLVAAVGCGGTEQRGTDEADRLPSTSTSTATSAPRGTPTTLPGSTSTSAAASTTTTVVPQPLAGRVVVVDPGHNGANGAHPAEIGRLVDAGGFSKACNTTGTAAAGITESRVNWQQALVLRTVLEEAGATVVLTRTDDEGWGPCIDERGLTAQRAGADALVSLHVDGAAPNASGFHVISATPGTTVTQGVATSSSALATALRDALVANGFAPANYLAGGSGLVARGDLGTLNRAGVTAVMLEAGNLRNDADRAVLTSPDGQRRVALAILAALEQTIGEGSALGA
jgi:N-acetylmuramoyl-L-alanine amidase